MNAKCIYYSVSDVKFSDEKVIPISTLLLDIPGLREPLTVRVAENKVQGVPSVPCDCYLDCYPRWNSSIHRMEWKPSLVRF